MAAMRVVGRPSGSYLGGPAVLGRAAFRPYRPARGAPYRRGQLPIVELPMAVTPVLRLHVIGTSVVTFPSALRRRNGRGGAGAGPSSTWNCTASIWRTRAADGFPAAPGGAPARPAAGRWRRS